MQDSSAEYGGFPHDGHTLWSQQLPMASQAGPQAYLRVTFAAFGPHSQVVAPYFKVLQFGQFAFAAQAKVIRIATKIIFSIAIENVLTAHVFKKKVLCTFYFVTIIIIVDNNCRISAEVVKLLY